MMLIVARMSLCDITYLSEVKEIGTTALGAIHLASLSTDRAFVIFPCKWEVKNTRFGLFSRKIVFLSLSYINTPCQHNQR